MVPGIPGPNWGKATVCVPSRPANSLSNLWTILPKKLHSALFFSNLCPGSFPKGKRLQRDTWNENDIMGLMKRKILQLLLTKLDNTFYPWKKMFTLPPCLSLTPTSLSQTPSSCSYPQTATGREDYKNNNSILYANIFIEVGWLKFLSNNQPPSTTETHSTILHAIYY